MDHFSFTNENEEEISLIKIPDILFKLAIVWNKYSNLNLGKLLATLKSRSDELQGRMIVVPPNNIYHIDMEQVYYFPDNLLNSILDAEIQNIIDRGYDEEELLTDTAASIMAFEEEIKNNKSK